MSSHEFDYNCNIKFFQQLISLHCSIEIIIHLEYKIFKTINSTEFLILNNLSYLTYFGLFQSILNYFCTWSPLCLPWYWNWCWGIKSIRCTSCFYWLRPILYGLACGGPDGVNRVLEILKRELTYDMACCGITSVDQINKEILYKHV